ncbi:hypothetical protein NFI96_006700 [Prochilodus magdalenae]|nr:hypothetical protein NFI96_006700 [Prochilodus magdalenae]
MQLLRVAWALAGAALCCALLLLLHSRLLKEENFEWRNVIFNAELFICQSGPLQFSSPEKLMCCYIWEAPLLIHYKAESQLAAGTCEIVTLDRDSSQPRRTIARQTARCACKKGQIAGTTRARPACVDARIVRTKQWCDMVPCLEDEGCDLLVNRSGWTCTQPGGRVKTTTKAVISAMPPGHLRTLLWLSVQV